MMRIVSFFLTSVKFSRVSFKFYINLSYKTLLRDNIKCRIGLERVQKKCVRFHVNMHTAQNCGTDRDTVWDGAVDWGISYGTYGGATWRIRLNDPCSVATQVVAAGNMFLYATTINDIELQ